MATIYETLRADIIIAVKARDTAAATTLRSCDAAIQRASMDQAKPIDDALALATLRKAVKNLNDAMVEFERGGRMDLVTANKTELRLIEKYLPKGLDAAKIEALVIEAIAETGALSKKDMGKVIGSLKKSPEAALIDFGAVSKLVQAKLPQELP
ncbi:MAG: GatB/YqeY domain-containing protein [Opitutaceae bacterium]